MSPIINSGNKELDSKINEYLEYASTLNTALEIKKLLSEERYDELSKIMMTRLTFGTAGLRGRMGPGYAAMNDLVIIQTSQGLCAYLDSIVQNCPSEKLRGIVIGYDNRYNSDRFSQLAAVSFLLKKFKVYLFSKMTPTPFIPFAVKKLKCLAGIMVTASHNPKDDNGYKVYWSNGAQIKPPHDKNIQECILKNLKPWSNAFDVSLVWTSPLAYDPLTDIEQMYYSDLKTSLGSRNFLNQSMKITFTAMHGVAHSYVVKAFQKLQYENYIAVKEQMYPDPNFPTVIFPNPEENNCLDLSIMTADKNDCKLILANDPDGDRLAVAEKLSNGKWHVYSGNEVGALLGSFLWKKAPEEWKQKPDMCCMISSTVSSKILRSIASKEGFIFYETLTGFKWMANQAYDSMGEGMKFIFAFEEAIGYMCGSTVLDKDGIQAAMQIASMSFEAHESGKLLYDLLKETYLKYGYHVSCNSYFICHDPVAIKSMFESLRNYNGASNQYPVCLENGKSRFSVAAVRDLTTGYDSRQHDKKAILPSSSSTQMITFYFENGCEATLRTSGTEPKVKYYTEMIAEVPENEWEEKNKLLKEMVDAIISQWMQPEKNGFLYRPS